MMVLNYNFFVCLSTIAAIILLLILLFNILYKKFNMYKNNISIINNIDSLPVPIMIVDMHSNVVIKCNDILKNTLGFINMENKSLSYLNIFNDFNDYLSIKKTANNNITYKDKIKFKINNEIVLLDTAYNITKYNNKKYIIMAIDSKVNIMEYIRYLGIFMTIINKTNSGIIISKFGDNNDKANPKIIYANDSVEKIIGKDKSQLLNFPLLDTVFSLNIKDKDYTQLSYNIENLKPFSMECEYTKFDGSICWLLIELIFINKNNIIHSIEDLINSNNAIIDNLKYNLTDVDLFITIKQTDISKYKSLNYTDIINTTNDIINKKNNAIEILTATLANNISNAESDIYKMVETVGKILHANTGCILSIKSENSYNKDTKQIIEYNYKWYNDEYSKKMLFNKDILNNIDGFELYTNLLANKLVKLYKQQLKSQEFKNIYNSNNINALIACSIFKNKKLVGFICFTNNDNDRAWDTHDENIMRIFANKLNDLNYLK